MPDDDVTTGEIARQVKGMGDSLDRLTVAVHSLDVKHAGDFVRLGGLEARVVSLEEWKRWAVRIIVGGVAAAILALVLR